MKGRGKKIDSFMVSLSLPPLLALSQPSRVILLAWSITNRYLSLSSAQTAIVTMRCFSMNLDKSSCLMMLFLDLSKSRL